MKPIKVLCLTVSIVVSSSSFAYSQNVQQPELDPIANEEHFTLLGLSLLKDTLEGVRSRLGKAEIRVGVGHEPSEVCYVSSEQNDGTTVIFQAGLFGYHETLTSFILTNKKVATRQCLPSPLVAKDIGTPSGITLGLRSSQLKELLGEPTRVDKNLLIYVLATERRITEDNPNSLVGRFIEAEIADGQVEQVRITKLESN